MLCILLYCCRSSYFYQQAKNQNILRIDMNEIGFINICWSYIFFSFLLLFIWSTKFNAQWIQNIIKCFIDRIFDQKFTYPWNWFILIPRRFMSKNINKTKVKWILILLPTKYVSNGIIMCTNISFVGSDLGWMYCAIQIIISKMNSS